MNLANKLQTVIILTSVLLGIVLGQLSFAQAHADKLIMPFLMIMLYGLFLQIQLRDIKNSFLNYKFTFTSVAINFIWTPVFAWLLGRILLNDVPELWLGFIMLMVTPCTDWYLVFTSLAKGNVPLGASILPLNFILQIVLLPFYLVYLGGAFVSIDVFNLLRGTLFVLAVPLILASISRKLSVSFFNKEWFDKNILSKTNAIQMIFLNLAIVAMFASQASIMIKNPALFLKLLPPVIIFFIVNFIVGQLTGRALKFQYRDIVALNLTTLARNSPISLAIAVASFPDKPLISLALIIGPLIELPVLALISQLLLMIHTSTPINNKL
ncbi:sodium bile acid symporter family protein [Oxobacter pfennigii]|uniref:Sodium bile acid symporter family protein n=1 Tax=Oxobacter pfennigii TaxID=36849 RepID=A0A0N8NTV2_9CLOT|nr:arsenic resistance protein [Oxobacter pfennigii]KPU45864.1 sodium bile acid symporter family protein [Oxobacter pfennigii]